MRTPWLLVVAAGFVCYSSDAQTQTAARRVPLVEELKIDGARADISGQFRRLWLGNDGRTAFMNAPEAKFVFFDSAGKRLGAFGANGEGPGEFTPSAANLFVFNTGTIGDTMWVYMSNNRRLTLIGPDLKLVRATTLPPRDSSIISFTPHALLPGGRMFGTATLGLLRSSRSQLLDGSQDTLVVMTQTGTVERKFGPVPTDSANARGRRPSGASVSIRIPFVQRPTLFTSLRGDRVAMLSARPTSATGGTFQLRVMRTTGETVYSKTYPYTSAPVTKRMADSAYARITSIYSPETPGNAEPLRLVKERMPSVTPFFESATLASDGSVWIVRELPSDKPDEMLLLSPAGDIVGTAQFPRSGLSLERATRTHLWATEVDADGFVSIVRFRIELGRSAPAGR